MLQQMSRVHYNFLKQLPIVVIFSLISGLFHPIPTAIATGMQWAGLLTQLIWFSFVFRKGKISPAQ